MFGLPIIDLIVIVTYFAIVIAIGVRSSRRIKNQEDYFLAGRRFGKLVQTFAAFGQGTSADTAVSVSTTTFTNGASGIWSSLLYLFGTPAYWLVTPWLRRLRLLTMGDFFLERYGSNRMAATYAVIGTFSLMSLIAVGFSAMTKTIVAMMPKTAVQFTPAEQQAYERAATARNPHTESTSAEALTYNELLERETLQTKPSDSLSREETSRLLALEAKRPATTISHIRQDVVIWIVCVIVLLYAVAGGLEAAFLTDMIQGMFIILLSVLLIPFGWSKINEIHGGAGVMDALRTIHRELPRTYFEVFGSPHAIDFTWYYIAVISLMATLCVVVQPNQIVISGSAKDELASRYGVTVGSFIKRLCTVFWGVFGLAAIVLYTGKVHHSDLVWGYATRDLLGPLGMGLVGLMIACLMAALMSTVDCLMLTCSSLLTHNLYAPLVRGRSQHHYVWVGRAFGAAVVTGGAWIALQFDTILQILKFFWEINVIVMPAFWLGMKWRRAHRAGAWVSIVAGGLLFLIIPMLGPRLVPKLRTNEYLLKTTEPAPLTRSYVAREADVILRQSEIEAWDKLRARGNATGDRPIPLAVDQTFEVDYTLPRKSVFWTLGIERDSDGHRLGKGSLNTALLLLNASGWDLSRNPYALNETLRISFRIAASFLIMVLISLLAGREEETRIDRFYAKMRTKVHSDPETDAQEVALSLENVRRHDDLLLLPGSNWELFKWNREDIAGFAAAIAAVCGILLLMMLLVSLGG